MVEWRSLLRLAQVSIVAERVLAKLKTVMIERADIRGEPEYGIQMGLDHEARTIHCRKYEE